MTLATPDFESCDPKCRCLGGELAGTVYNCNRPCTSPTATFDPNSCECVDPDGPTSPINCCLSEYKITYTATDTSTLNYCNSELSDPLNGWPSNLGEITYENVSIFLPMAAKFQSSSFYANSGGNADNQCDGYNPFICAQTLKSVSGGDLILRGATEIDGSESLSGNGFCGLTGLVWLLFETCSDYTSLQNGITYPAGSIVAYAQGGGQSGLTTPIPDSVSLENITAPCPECYEFNKGTCGCELEDPLPDDFSGGVRVYFTYEGWKYCGEPGPQCSGWTEVQQLTTYVGQASSTDPISEITITSMTPIGNPENLNGCNNGEKQRQGVFVTIDIVRCSGFTETVTPAVYPRVGQESSIVLAGWDYTVASGEYPNAPAEEECP